MNHSSCSDYRDDDVLHLVDEDASCLLGLLEFKRLHLHTEQVCLRVLPFPSSALLTILQLDFLHGGDKLISFVIVDGLLLKQFIVEHLSPFQEQGHPSAIEDTSQQKNDKHQFIIEKQYHREYHEGEHGKRDVERLLRQESIYSAMVVHSLHQVAHKFRVKERHRQLQKFDEEVAHQRYVDAQRYV